MKNPKNTVRLMLVISLVCLALAAPNDTATAQSDSSSRGPEMKWEYFRRSASDPAESYRLYDKDIIMIKTEERAVPKDEVEFVMESGLNVTWWKGIEIVYWSPERPGPLPISFILPWDAPTRAILNSLYTQDADHGPKSMRVKLNALDARPHTLVFLKAKAFGAHTPMYYLPLYQRTRTSPYWKADTARLAGKRISFTWEAD